MLNYFYYLTFRQYIINNMDYKKLFKKNNIVLSVNSKDNENIIIKNHTNINTNTNTNTNTNIIDYSKIKNNIIKSELVKTELVKTELVKTELVKTEPVKTEPEKKVYIENFNNNEKVFIENTDSIKIIKKDIDNKKISKSDIINEYYRILEEKPISDHEPIVSIDTKIISWNVQKDSCYNEIYSWDLENNYLNNFSKDYVEEINNIYGIGENFRKQMELESKFETNTNNRYEKICKKLINLLYECDNSESNKNISNNKYRIYLQECSLGLYEYLKNNLKFKHIKFISQDIDNVYVGGIKKFCKELEYLFNWYLILPDKKKNKELNQLILSNQRWKKYINDLKKSKNEICLDNKIIDIEWKKFIITDDELWYKFVLIIDNKLKSNDIATNKKKSSGSVIISNYPFILMPCFTRMLYTNCIISPDKNISNTFGSFCIKARGCIGIDLENKKNPPVINVHFPKHRVDIDYTKILENDFFSFNFEITNQIDKYFFCKGEETGLDYLLNKIYPNKIDNQNDCKKNFLSSVIKILIEKFIDNIFECNNFKKDILNPFCINDKNNISINDNINFDLDNIINNSNEYHNIDLLELTDLTKLSNLNINNNMTKQYYLDTKSINVLLDKINKNKKIYIVGDFNCALEKIITIDKKYQVQKYLNMIKNLNIKNFNNNNLEEIEKYLNDIDEQKYYNLIKKYWTITNIINSSKIDHIIQLEFVENKFKIINDISLIFSQLAKNITNQFYNYSLKKKGTIISIDANCPYKKDTFGIKKNYNLDFEINFIDKYSQGNIISQILLDLLFYFKIDLIVKDIEDNITYSDNNQINNKIYLQNISYHFVDIIKYSSLKFKYIKFIGETICSIYLTDTKKNLELPLEKINFPKRNNDNIFKLYNEYNNFGFCILSNEPFVFLPCLPICSIKSQINNINDIDQKMPLNITITTNACIDLNSSSNVLMINQYSNIDEYLKENTIKCSMLQFNGGYVLNKINSEDFNFNKEINKNEISIIDNKKLLYIIKYLRYIIISKYIQILLDVNKDVSDYINQQFIEKKYNIDDIFSQLDNFEVKFLSEEFIHLFSTKKINEITVIGQYSKKNSINDLKNIIEEYKKIYKNKLTNFEEFFSKDKYENKIFDNISKIKLEKDFYELV